jgi:carboxyl-terminal processing protease
LVIGAPAWKSKQVSEGDEVLKVKSDPKKEAVNVVGMLVDEAVRLIRGAKGSEVTLTLRKKDGSVKEVKLIREEVEMEDTFAKSIVVNSPNGKKYGFITYQASTLILTTLKEEMLLQTLKMKLQSLKLRM